MYQGHSDQVFGPTTYAQSGEDLCVLNIFALLGIHRPSYLDIGAHLPLDCSNTALMYRRGSRGVAVEANPDLIQGFVKERPEDVVLNFGIGPVAGVMTFYRIDVYSGRNTFSEQLAREFVEAHPQYRITDTLQVPVFTLNDIISRHFASAPPDFLSLDTEGLDADILRAADLTRARPKVICAEVVSTTDGSSSDAMSEVLKGRSYIPYVRTWGNGIYVAAECAGPLRL